MKILRFIVILSSIYFSIFTISNSNESNDKIAYINIEYVISNSIKGKSILNNLDIIQKNNSNELKKFEKKINSIETDIKKTKNIISDQELNDKINLLKKSISEYKTLKNSMSMNLKKKRNEDIQNFMKKINPILENFMEENSYSVLLDGKNVIIGKKSNNLTNEILKIVDNNIK